MSARLLCFLHRLIHLHRLYTFQWIVRGPVKEFGCLECQWQYWPKPGPWSRAAAETHSRRLTPEDRP